MTKIISRAVTATSRSKYTPSSSSKSGGVGASTLVESVGGSSVDILKTTSSVAESDSNVYSALRATKEITSRAVSKINDDTVVGNISFLKDINVAGAANIAGVLTASEVDATEIRGTNGTFQNLLKAAAVTIAGLATLGSVEATTLHAASGTIDTLRSTVGTIDTLNSTNGNINALNGATAFFTNYVKSPIGNFTNLNAGYLPYHTENGLVNSSIRTDGAKVGIGASPIYGLDVNGTFRATSDMFADGNIGTRNYVSQTAGWRVGANGLAEFRKIYADELDVQAFTAQVSQSLAGSDFLTKSVSKLSANFVIPSLVGNTAQLIVDDLEGFPSIQCFANGDYIRLRPINKSAGLIVGNAYGTVTLDTTYGTNGFLNGTQAYTFTVTSLNNGAGLTVFKGSEVLDYGTSGSGVIARTVLDSAGSPYEQIATWTSDPSNSNNYTVHARLGNLAGITNCSGYGLYSDNVFLTKSIVIGDLTKSGNYLSFDATNGLVIKLGGTNVATTTDVGNSLSTANNNAQGYASSAQSSAIATANGYADTAITNIQIGGVNLLHNTKVFTECSGLGIDSSGYGNIGTYVTQSDGSLLVTNNNSNTRPGFYFTAFAGVKYILSVSFKVVSGDAPTMMPNGNIPNIVRSISTDTGGYTRVHFSFSPDSDTNASILVQTGVDYTGYTNSFLLRNAKLEIGTKATDWSPAPEDLVTTTVYQSGITALQNSIALKVSQTDFNALGTRVSSTESAINLLPGTIDARITTQINSGGSIYTAVAASLTLDGNGISLFGKTINIDGATIFGTINTNLNKKADSSSLGNLAYLSTLNYGSQYLTGFGSLAAASSVAWGTNVTNIPSNLAGLTGSEDINNANIQIGGTNLLKNSDWHYSSCTLDSSNQFMGRDSVKDIITGFTSNVWMGINLNFTPISNKPYSFGIWCFTDDIGSIDVGAMLEIIGFGADGSTRVIDLGVNIIPSKNNNWEYFKIENAIFPDSVKSIQVWLYLVRNGRLWINSIKGEFGTKATDWSPAPEDVTTNIATSKASAQDNLAMQLGYTNYETMSSMVGSTQTLIKNGYINTTLLEANSIAGNYISAGAITADKIAAQSITTGKLSADLFSAGYINANYINATTILTNALTAGTIYAGNAVVQGLRVTNATISGTLSAVSGSFSSLASTNNRMLLSDTLLEFKNSDDLTTTPIVYNRWLKIGSNLLSSSDGDVLSMMDVYVNRVTTYLNVGIHIDVSGVVYENSRSQTSSVDAYRGNRALYIEEGSICGFRLNGRPVSGGQVISKLDSWLFPQATTTVTYYLPLNCEMGQEFFFKKLPGTASYNIAINPSSSDTMWWDGASGRTSISPSDDKTYTLVYCKYNAHWGVTVSAN